MSSVAAGRSAGAPKAPKLARCRSPILGPGESLVRLLARDAAYRPAGNCLTLASQRLEIIATTATVAKCSLRNAASHPAKSASSHVLHIDAFEQQLQIRVAHRPLQLTRMTSHEDTALESLRPDAKARAIEIQGLQIITPAVREHIEPAGKRVFTQHVLDQGIEPIEGLALMRCTA